MQVALYARVSTSTQQKEATIESQISKLKEQIQINKWLLQPEHIYLDEGISGARLDRPALDRLRDAARRAEFDAVIVLSPDRLARNYAHQWLLIEELGKSQVKVIFLENPFGDTAQGKLLVQMQGMIAEYERAAILERTRRGRIEKARRGEFIPWAYNCYGYCYLAKRSGLPPQVSIDQQQAEVVRLMFRLLVQEQLSMRQITKRLNEANIATPTGRKERWYVSTVAQILNNPAYMGRAHGIFRSSAGTTKYPCARITRPAEEWIWVESPVIISPEMFAKGQIQLQRNRAQSWRSYHPHSGRYLLRGKVKCGLCTLAMNSIRQKIDKGELLYYRCSGKDAVNNALLKACPARLVRAQELDELVWQALVQLLEQPQMIAQLHQQFSNNKNSDIERLKSELALLSKRRKRLEQQIQKLVDAYQEDVITLTELKVRRKKIETDIVALRAQENQLNHQQQKVVHWQEFAANVEKFTKLLGKNLLKLSFEDRQAVAQALIEKIVVTEQNVDIYYVFPFEDPPTLPDGQLPADHQEHFYRLCLSNRNLL